jgi:hypothetical protein
MMKTKTFFTVLFGTFLFQMGCTEPYEIETVDYENVLVVESTITDELKPQTVKLSRTSSLENTDVLTENSATVTVVGDNGDNFSFSQDNGTGFYVSDQPFRVQPNTYYTLNIVTQDGKRYTSSTVTLPPSVEMDEVYAERIVSPTDDKDGVQVLVNTEDPTGNSKYFRYEYEETYKIVAPYPSPYTAEIINFDDEYYTFEVILTPREPEIICYSTEYSTGIDQTATTELNENRVVRFPVKYLSKLDAKMQTRYSILVKQYVQSVEAYTFYKIVKELGSVGSLLSQGQPGYVAGNMVSEANPDEKVLGFFEASSMTSKRIYFNYEDFGLDKPPYFVDCDLLVLDYRDNSTLDNDPNDRETIFTYISYLGYQVVQHGPWFQYTIAKQECAVCTSFSSNVRPDFWED